MPSRRRRIAAATLATLGLSSLSPMQQGAMLVTAGTAALTASPALALGKLKGKLVKNGDSGTIIRSISDGLVIVVPVDPNGEVRLTGLEPGDYEVASLRLTAAAPVRGTGLHVSEDGRLAFAMQKSAKQVEAVGTERTRKSKPDLALSAEAIPFDGPAGIVPVDAVMLDLRQSFAVVQPPPCDPLPGRPDTCNRTPQRNHVDVNASSAEEMTRQATTLTPEAARVIIAERTRAPFTSAGDFARRVCPQVEVDFDDAAVRMGSTSILMKRGGDPKANGFKCGPREETVRLFWVTFPFFNLASWL